METATDHLQSTIEFRRRGLLAAALYLMTVFAVGGIMWGFIWNEGANRPHLNLAGAVATQPAKYPVIAGTGAALPLLQRLASDWNAAGGRTILVAPSIGSSGGLAALSDGVIDCAIVSRALNPQESEGKIVHPLAMAPIVLAAGQGARLHKVSGDKLVRLVGHQNDPDVTGAGFVLREPGDSAQEVLAQAIPGLRAAIVLATEQKSWPLAFTDADMERFLIDRSNSVGVFDLGTISLKSLPLRAIPIDGAPDRFLRPFTLVCRQAHRLGGFLEYLDSATAQETLRSAGYLVEEN
jgi:phosphate transport system substrate-binding protein